VSDATDSPFERREAASDAHTDMPGLYGKRAIMALRRKDDE
jgi:hypothetical protein